MSSQPGEAALRELKNNFRPAHRLGKTVVASRDELANPPVGEKIEEIHPFSPWIKTQMGLAFNVIQPLKKWDLLHSLG